MFRTILTCFACMCFAFQLLAQKAHLSGTLERAPQETIHVLLYPEFGYGHGYLGRPVDSLSTEEDTFSFTTDPGKYVLAVFGINHDPLIIPVILKQPGANETLTQCI